MQFAGDIGNHLPDFARRLGTFLQEFLSCFVRRLCNQLLEDVPGYVDTVAESFDKEGIVFRSFDHPQEPELRETCAGITGQGMEHLLIAGDNEDIRHGFGDEFPLGYREKMLLAFGTGNRNQGFGGRAAWNVEERALLRRSRHRRQAA